MFGAERKLTYTYTYTYAHTVLAERRLGGEWADAVSLSLSSVGHLLTLIRLRLRLRLRLPLLVGGWLDLSSEEHRLVRARSSFCTT